MQIEDHSLLAAVYSHPSRGQGRSGKCTTCDLQLVPYALAYLFSRIASSRTKFSFAQYVIPMAFKQKYWRELKHCNLGRPENWKYPLLMVTGPLQNNFLDEKSRDFLPVLQKTHVFAGVSHTLGFNFSFGEQTKRYSLNFIVQYTS